MIDPVGFEIGGEHVACLVHLLPFSAIIEEMEGGAGVILIPEVIEANNRACINHQTGAGGGPEAAFVQGVRGVPKAQSIFLAESRVDGQECQQDK